MYTNKITYYFIFFILSCILFKIIKSIKGNNGEKKVSKKINNIFKKSNEEYKLLNNILLPAKANSKTQIDHILINKFGIFVIETKNYNALKIVGHLDDKYWTSCYRNNNYTFYNPIKQNVGHIIAVKKIIKNIPIYNKVVFIKNTDLSSLDNSYVLNLNTLSKNDLLAEKQVLSKEDIIRIYNEIKKHNSMNIFNNIKHIFNVKLLRFIKG